MWQRSAHTISSGRHAHEKLMTNKLWIVELTQFKARLNLHHTTSRLFILAMICAHQLWSVYMRAAVVMGGKGENYKLASAALSCLQALPKFMKGTLISIILVEHSQFLYIRWRLGELKDGNKRWRKIRFEFASIQKWNWKLLSISSLFSLFNSTLRFYTFWVIKKLFLPSAALGCFFSSFFYNGDWISIDS